MQEIIDQEQGKMWWKDSRMPAVPARRATMSPGAPNMPLHADMYAREAGQPSAQRAASQKGSIDGFEEGDVMPQHFLKKFFLRVHPDLFHNDKTYRLVNENSLKSLNSILDYAQELENLKSTPAEKRAAPPNPPADQTLTFYVVPVGGLTDSARVPAQLTTRFKSGRVQGGAEEPGALQQQVQAVQKLLAKLVLDSGIEVDEEVQQRWRFVFFGEGRTKTDPDIPEMDVRKAVLRVNTFDNGSHDERINLLPAMQSAGLLRFSPELDMWERMSATLKFRDAIEKFWDELQCHRWAGCGVYFTHSHKFAAPEGGVFYVPARFQVPQLLEYFDLFGGAFDDSDPAVPDQPGTPKP